MSKLRGNNLVALGSAAVLIVYTAGFAKTKPAADRMAAESAERRPRGASRAGAGAVGARTAGGESGGATVPAMPAVAVVNGPLAAAPAANVPGTVAPSAGGASAPMPVPVPSTMAVAVSPAAAAVAKPAAATAAAPVAPVETAPPTVVSAPLSVAVTPPAVTAPAAATSAPAPVQTAPVPVSTPAPVAPPAAPPPAAKPAGKTTYKDGVYLGRGTSRHGDIEAMVEIQNGRITNAVISQCLTRYSCSWIAVLVPQVVARQSAEVDYVSGATVSSDAFYYAVTQALAQAK